MRITLSLTGMVGETEISYVITLFNNSLNSVTKLFKIFMVRITAFREGDQEILANIIFEIYFPCYGNVTGLLPFLDAL